MGNTGTARKCIELSVSLVGLILFCCPQVVSAAPFSERVLCSTFPICQIVKNVTKGRDGLSVDALLPAALGCPHDYALGPRDIQKLAKADALVINGSGMEEFLGAPLQKANSDIFVIDSSAGISELLNYTEIEEHHESHEHDHNGVNPHLFASPRMAGILAKNIAGALSLKDPAGASLYAENAKSYAAKMDRLGDDFRSVVASLRNNRIITQHGVLDYLARDSGLQVVGVLQPHAGESLSAGEVLHAVKEARKERAGAVFTEPQYPASVGQTVAKEAGIAYGVLDPVASGPEDAPLDYYEVVMRKNIETLRNTLGVK